MNKSFYRLQALLAGSGTFRSREADTSHTHRRPRCCGKKMRHFYKGVAKDHWKCDRCEKVRHTEWWT